MMKRVNHQWTDEERDIVRREYAGTHKSRREIAAKLGVTEFAVAGQISKMGIALVTDRRLWTEEEEERLRELLETRTVNQAAKILKRSVNSVTVKAKRIRCSRRDRFGWYTKREICAMLGVDHRWVQRRIDGDQLRASSHYGGSVQQDGMSAWHIKEADLKAFICRYPDELNGRNVDLVAIVNVLAGVRVER